MTEIHISELKVNPVQLESSPIEGSVILQTKTDAVHHVFCSSRTIDDI